MVRTSTYSEQLCPGLFPRHSRTATLQWRHSPSTQVHTWCILSMAQWFISTYHFVPCYSIIPPCTALLWYILPCTAGHDSEDFDILFWYSVHPDLHSADHCADLDVLSTKLKCQNPQNSDRLYMVVCTATEQYKVVWYYSMVQSGTYQCIAVPTEYVLEITNISQVCTDMQHVCT